MDDFRESIWGISPRDRRWFQLMTLAGGAAGSVILTLLEVDSPATGSPASQLARNIALDIGASFVASGFIAWGLLQVKELFMPIGDWIREANERRRQRLREEGRQIGLRQGREEGLQLGREEGRLKALREIYGADYSDPPDGESGPPPPSGDQNGANGKNETGPSEE